MHGKICFDGAFIVPVLADVQQKTLGGDAHFVPVVPDVTELTPPEVSVLRYARGMADCPNLVLNEKPSLHIEPAKSIGCDTDITAAPGTRHAGEMPVGRTSAIKFMGRFWKLHAEVLLSCTSIASVFIPLLMSDGKPARMTLGDITARVAAQYWFAYKYKEDKPHVRKGDGYDYITGRVCDTYTVRFKAAYPGHGVSPKWFGVELTDVQQQELLECESVMEGLVKSECKGSCKSCFSGPDVQRRLRVARCTPKQLSDFCAEVGSGEALELEYKNIYLFTPQVQIEVAVGVVASLNLGAATVIDPLQDPSVSTVAASTDLRRISLRQQTVDVP